MAVVVCKQEFLLRVKEVDGKKYLFKDIGKEKHEKVSFRLWVHPSLAEYDKEYDQYILNFPIRNARVDDGKSAFTKILRPDQDLNVFYVVVKCGYRGESAFEIVDDQDVVKLDKFYIYESPKGNLGISMGALITTKSDSLKIKWTRTGRLYGSEPEGISIIRIDGSCEEFEELEDLSELEDISM